MHLFRLNQTLAKHLNLLSVLCEKSSMGLTRLAPGGGIGQECVELDSGKITLFSTYSPALTAYLNESDFPGNLTPHMI